MVRMHRPFVLLVALGLGAGCSSGSGSDAASTTTRVPRTTTTSLTPAQQAVQPLLHAGRLRADDLPAEFRDTGTPVRSRADAIIAGESACEPFRLLTDHGTATAFSPETRDDAGVTAFDQVDAFADEAAATARIELTQDPRIVDCLTARYAYPFTKGTAVLPPDTTFTGVDVSPLALDPAGTDITGFRITSRFDVKVDGATKTQEVLTHVVFLQVGRVLVTLHVTGGSAADFARIETTAVPAIAARVQTATAA